MPDRYNEAFWDHLEQLVTSSRLVIDRARGSAHPDYPNMIYPYDYGYLSGTTSSDGGGIDIFIGSGDRQVVTGVICTVDLVKRDSEIKVLLGCSEAEMHEIVEFLNDNENMYCYFFGRDA